MYCVNIYFFRIMVILMCSKYSTPTEEHKYCLKK